MYKISVKTRFASAHRLRGYEGLCENLHGHNWVVTAIIGTNKLDEIGIAYDFKKLKNNLNDIIDKLDHQFLNEVSPFDKINPTSEHIAEYIFKSLASKLESGIRVISVEVEESEQYKAVYEE